jgi:1-acylglycerone phosphate reductase
MFDVNVFALISVTQAFAPLLIASKGTIINIGSIAGKFPVPWQGYYNASKAAVNLLSDNLRIELKPFGVKVINVVTGGVKTHFFDNQPPTKLPENSLYSAGRKEVEWAANGRIVEKDAMHVEQYAEMVVKNALKRRPKVIQWAGPSPFLIWFFATFLWDTFWVRIEYPSEGSNVDEMQDFMFPIMYKFPDFARKALATEAAQ